MPWNKLNRIIDSQSVAPGFVLEIQQVQGEPYRASARLYTHDLPGIGGVKGPGLVGLPDGIQLSGQSVTPGTWSASPLSFECRFAPSQSGQTFIKNSVRGSVVRLLCGPAGGDYSEYEPIAIGQIIGIGGVPPLCNISAGGLYNMLESRFTTIKGKLNLFSQLGSTTLSAGYTAGDTTLNVSATTNFVKEGSSGMLKITPTTGDPFYLTWSAKGASTITVGTTGALTTTAVNAVTGNTVECVAYLAGHPFDILKKILTSTGGGTNGPWDTLPENWGYGLPYSWIDDTDTKLHAARMASGISWDIVATEQDNGGEWIRSTWAAAGVWLCQRQGQITIRCATDPNQSTSFAVGELLGEDINFTTLINWELWDTSTPVEYATTETTAQAATYSTTEAIGSRPALPINTRNIDDLLPIPTAALTDVRDRLEVWDLRVPERVGVRLPFWRCAGWCLGDIVLVSTEYLVQRNGQPYSKRPGLVVGVRENWGDFTKEVDLLFVPSWSEAFR